MKAIVYQKYGSPDVLEVKDIEKPVPGDKEVLIQVKASTATAPDTQMRKGTPYVGRFYTGLGGPKRPIPGYDFAGVIEAVGKEVTKFKIGDRVFGGSTTLGGYAEYKCASEDEMLVIIPAYMSFSDAAPMGNSAVTALNFLRLANVGPGQKVLVNGASGAVGTYAVQLARYFGAEVTGVCSAKNTAMVKNLGAISVIDYKTVDFTKSGNKYDIIFDAVGTTSFSACKSSLTDNGIFLSVALSFSLLGSIIYTSLFGKKKAKVSATGALSVAARLKLLKEVAEIATEKGVASVVDRFYSLNQIAEAHSYVETGRKTGNVIITI